MQNAELKNFVSDMCPQYYNITDSFLRKFKYIFHRTSHDVIFHLCEHPFRMTIEEFSEACKLPYWGACVEPRKFDCNEFLGSITGGETRGITQVTIGSIHFPAIHYFALFIGSCITGNRTLVIYVLMT